MMKLLIAYDGSPCSGEAIDDLRRAGLPENDVEALVVTVADVCLEVPATDYPILYPDAADQVRVQTDEAMSEAREFAEAGRARVAAIFPGWQIQAEAIADATSWGVVRKADDWPAELVVVGSHGRGALGRLAFGSVSQNAVLYAQCSVRIGRCHADRSGGDPDRLDGPTRIIVGWDGSEHARECVRQIADRRWRPGSEVRILTAMNSHLMSRLHGAIEPLVESAKVAADQLRAAGLTVETPALRSGDPKRILVEEARTWPAHTIFVGTRGLTRFARALVGSVASTVAARAACSVEVVHMRLTT